MELLAIKNVKLMCDILNVSEDLKFHIFHEEGRLKCLKKLLLLF